MLTILSGISLILPFIASLLTFNKADRTHKKLSVFIFVFVPIEAYAFYLNFSGQHNLYLFHLFTYLEGFFYAIIFFDILKGSRKKAIPYLFGLFFLFSLINSFYWEPLDSYNSNQRSVGGVITLLYVLGYFTQIFSEAEIQKIERDTYFFMSSSLLIYTAGTLFLFILADQVLTVENYAYYDLHSVLNILLNIGFTITLWMGTKRSR
jgi:hypothetical protein